MLQLIALLRICILSLILSVGYGINFFSVWSNDSPDLTPLYEYAYMSSSAWLFISCLLMVQMTLFGFQITLLSTMTRRCAISLPFFIGSCGYVASILLGLLFQDNNSDKYISWQYEILYAALPLYLTFLIIFFDHERFTPLINLILCSLVLFITPCTQLIHHYELTRMPTFQSLSCLETSAYLSICIALLFSCVTNTVSMCKYYTSGLFIKSVIIALLIYGYVILIVERVHFDTYADTYRIYYYYVLLASLFVIYSCEVFIPGKKRLVQKDINDIMRRPSFNIDLERMQTLQITRSYAKTHIRGLLQRCRKIQVPTLDENGGSVASASDEASVSDNIIPRITITNFNPNENIEGVIKIFPDFKPEKKNKDLYFSEFQIRPPYVKDVQVPRKESVDRVRDSIAAIVPFYNEKACEIHATLKALYENFEFIKKKDSKYKFTHFNVLLVGDGWFKADISTKRYLTKLYNIKCDDDNKDALDNFSNFTPEKGKSNTVILQTKHNRKLCINPFRNDDKKLYLKMTTIIKIDNRKKANSHEWFLGKHGFAEWCQCDYMFFTDAYSTCAEESLYRMLEHMNDAKNQDVVCCTGRARVYSIEQELDLQNLLRETYDTPVEESKYNDLEEETYKWWQNDIFKKDNEIGVDLLPNDGKKAEEEDIFYQIQDTEFDHRLTANAHLRDCQMFEFEALYGTIGCYLLGGFLPVIPGPCGFYRSKYMLNDEVRGWYFEKINQANDPDDMDLVLGNMKLAEDRILTITSVLNSDTPVRHSLITECVFYFDPIPNITQLMKQRRRWLNGSIATVIFILRKISFTKWNVNVFRKYYVLSIWYMQLCMYLVTSLSPALIFTIAFQYGLTTLLTLLFNGDTDKMENIPVISTTFVVISWLIYLTFIYFMQRKGDFKWRGIEIKKASIVSLALLWSYLFATLILMGTLIQMVNIFKPPSGDSENNVTLAENYFGYIVTALEIMFFIQNFILAPLVSKDWKTFTILVRTCVNYLVYSPFYVSFFFVNALANIHDLSWGTRPDNEAEQDSNPKRTTIKVLLIVIFMDIIIAFSVSTLSAYVWSHIIFFAVLAFPSFYQIFFSLIWLVQTRVMGLWILCLPKKMKEEIEYVGLRN